MKKLKAITFDKTPRIPGLRAGDMSTITCETPVGSLMGWYAVLRGPSLFLISPPGWHQNEEIRRSAKPDAPRQIHEIPRLDCYLHWSGSADDNLLDNNYQSEPFGPAPTAPEAKPSLLDALSDVGVPPHEMGDD